MLVSKLIITALHFFTPESSQGAAPRQALPHNIDACCTAFSGSSTADGTDSTPRPAYSVGDQDSRRKESNDEVFMEPLSAACQAARGLTSRSIRRRTVRSATSR